MAELIDAIGKGKFQYAIALGSELEVDASQARSALSKLKGIVTIATHDGPLAKASHIALPACSWVEVEGTYVNRQGMAQRSEKALRTRGDALPGWDLIGQLGRALGYAIGWKSLADVRRAMQATQATQATQAGAAAPQNMAEVSA